MKYLMPTEHNEFIHCALEPENFFEIIWLWYMKIFHKKLFKFDKGTTWCHIDINWFKKHCKPNDIKNGHII